MKKYFILHDVFENNGSRSGCFCEFEANSVKDCIIEYWKYLGGVKDVIAKGLNAFEETDLKSLIEYANLPLSQEDEIRAILEVPNDLWDIYGKE